jgi:hypothetical protein
MPEEIPPGLLKRWEEFGNLSKKCWLKAKGEGGSAAEQFPRFWDCMKQLDPVISKAEQDECASIGHPLAPHPICVLSNVSKGMDSADAVKMCLEEGRIHGISLIACRAAKEGAL